MKAVAILGTALIVVLTATADDEKASPLDELRAEADRVMRMPNVTMRRHVDILFTVTDQLLAEGLTAEAERYLVRGLEADPWRLNYQLVYAEMLQDQKAEAQARERAELVYTYSEDEDQIDHARTLLGRESPPTFAVMERLPGDQPTVLLIPFQGAEAWLMRRVQDELLAMLDVPVLIRQLDVDVPPHRRDARGSELNRLRRDLVPIMQTDEMQQFLADLKFSVDDLREEENMYRFMIHVLESTYPDSVESVLQRYEELRGLNPQWHTDDLLEALRGGVDPYRTDRVAYVAVTSADIYAGDYHFLFSSTPAHGSIVSYHRFKADFNRELPNQERLVRRTVKACLGPIGFQFGIGRCSVPVCPRAYPNSLREHDSRNYALCTGCATQFREVLAQSAD